MPRALLPWRWPPLSLPRPLTAPPASSCTPPRTYFSPWSSAACPRWSAAPRCLFLSFCTPTGPPSGPPGDLSASAVAPPPGGDFPAPPGGDFGPPPGGDVGPPVGDFGNGQCECVYVRTTVRSSSSFARPPRIHLSRHEARPHGGASFLPCRCLGPQRLPRPSRRAPRSGQPYSRGRASA